MNRILSFITALLLFSCQNSEKKYTSSENNCKTNKLVDYIFPLEKFVKEKIFVYSLKSNRDSLPKIKKSYYKLKIDTDSLLVTITKDTQEKTLHSSILSYNHGIPKIFEVKTRVNRYPELLPVEKIINGNRYCEYTTYEESFKYTIPIKDGEVIRNFTGYVTHKKYTTEVFQGIQYDCAIYESKKELIVSFNENLERVKATTKRCSCKNLGELYTIITLENGTVITNKLIEIIEK